MEGWQDTGEFRQRQIGRNSPAVGTEKFKDRSAGSSRREIVSMMQSVQSRHGNDLTVSAAGTIRLASGGRLLCQAEMSAIIVVVANVFRHEPFKMALVEDDDVVEQIAAAIVDGTLRHAVLPRTFESRPLRLRAESLDCLDYFRAKDRVPVVDQILGRCVVGKRLAQLLGNPGGTRIPGDIEVNYAPTVVSKKKKQ